MLKISGFYFITGAALSRAGNLSDVKNALKAGAKIVQYREKDISTRELYSEARKLKALCRHAIFLVNDRVDIALAVGADGVHLGNDDLPFALARKMLGKNKVIGLTVHSLKEALVAQKLGADYIGVAPIFSTHTKKDAGFPVGVEVIKKIKNAVKIPVIAVGGINLANAKEVIEAGADGICAISAVVTKCCVNKEIKKFQKLFFRV